MTSQFLYFIREREKARLRLPVDDEIVGKYRFCNVNREHDRVTRWIAANWRTAKFSSLQEAVKLMGVARIFNTPTCLSRISPEAVLECSLQQLIDRFDVLRDSGIKLFRGAYMMPVHGKNAHLPGMTAHRYYLEGLDSAVSQLTGKENRLGAVAEVLMYGKGIGDFIANQIVTDLRYTAPWGDCWLDWEEFILCGPGTRRGLDRFHGRSAEGTLNQPHYIAELKKVRKTLYPQFNAFERGAFMDPNNLSNCFCEFDKWCRAGSQLEAGKNINLTLYSAT